MGKLTVSEWDLKVFNGGTLREVHIMFMDIICLFTASSETLCRSINLDQPFLTNPEAITA
jgi:hypothetical protein